MNFLEELVAEFFEYRGYFIMRNKMLDKLSGGGRKGEIDILAYNPTDNQVVHIETSSDSASWDDRYKRFKKNFLTLQKNIRGYSPFHDI